jgi:hypothetical protein
MTTASFNLNNAGATSRFPSLVGGGRSSRIPERIIASYIRHWWLPALIALCLSPTALAQRQPLLDSRNVPVPPSLMDTISVQFVEVPIREALQIVARKGNFNLNYNENIFDKDELVTYSADHETAFQSLKSILDGWSVSIIVLKRGR